MSQNNEKDEPSVDEILSSIKDVIASDKNLSINKEDGDVIDDDVFELTDIIDDTEAEDIIDDIEAEENTNIQDNNDNIADIFEGGDISIDNVIREAVKDSIEDWFSRNLRSIVEESVKQEVSKLFKKRN